MNRLSIAMRSMPSASTTVVGGLLRAVLRSALLLALFPVLLGCVPVQPEARQAPLSESRRASDPVGAPPAGSAMPGAEALQRSVMLAGELMRTGAEAEARQELSCLLLSDPGNRPAQNLLRQIDADPLLVLGRESFAYRVQPGDTLATIARRFLGDEQLFYALARYNALRLPVQLRTGQTLRVPGRLPSTSATSPQGTGSTDTRTADAATLPREDARAAAIARHTRMARSAFAKQDLDGAVTAWNQVLAVDPTNRTAELERQKALDLQAKLNRTSGAVGRIPESKPNIATPATPAAPVAAAPAPANSPPTSGAPGRTRPARPTLGTGAGTRFVTVDSPPLAQPARPVQVLVTLSERMLTPEVSVGAPAGQSVRRDGSLPLNLPTSRSGWDIEVVLSAPGFDFDAASPSHGRLKLPVTGEAEPIEFTLHARAGEEGEHLLRATFWHEGRYLGSGSRRIAIVRAGGPDCAAWQARVQVPLQTVPTIASQAAGLELEDSPVAAAASADLYIYLRHDNPRTLGRGQIIVSSPHLTGNIATETFSMPADGPAWLEQWYARLNGASSGRGPLAQSSLAGGSGGGATMPSALPAGQKVALMRGFGQELYTRMAPPLLKRTLERLLADRPSRLTSIQVFSNNPSIPWELMRPGRIGVREVDFLGLEFRVARWHTDGSSAMRDQPVRQLAFRELLLLAPNYSGTEALPAQQDEVRALSGLQGFRRGAASYEGMRRLASAPPAGVVHFAGHGELRGNAAVQREYALRLEDGVIDATAWRGMARPGSASSLYFFNVCQLGVADSVGGTVAGWAPAILDSGAGGYIGGLWALHDRAAAEFAKRFYQRLAAAGPRGTPVAEAMRDARRLFLDTGDPTYLAYVFYGDVNLTLQRP